MSWLFPSHQSRNKRNKFQFKAGVPRSSKRRPNTYHKNLQPKSGAPNNAGVLLNTSTILLRLSKVLLDHWKFILSGAMKFVGVFLSANPKTDF